MHQVAEGRMVSDTLYKESGTSQEMFLRFSLSDVDQSLLLGVSQEVSTAWLFHPIR